MFEKEKDSQEYSEIGLGPHRFGDYFRKIRVSTSIRSVMSFGVFENEVVWTQTEMEIGTVSVRVFDVFSTNFIYPMNHVCEGIGFA